MRGGDKGTGLLLGCGGAAGPLFVGAVLAQDYARGGVAPREQPLSLLTLGDLGWVQVAVFVVAGLLNVAFAVGIRRRLRSVTAGTAGPLLVGGFGLGLVLAGVFRPDPAFGFPPGAPAGMATTLSWHAQLHDVAALLVFGCLVAATGVFARRFGARRERMRAMGAAGIGGAVLLLVGASSDPDWTSEALRAAVLLGWGWASWLAMRLRAEKG